LSSAEARELARLPRPFRARACVECGAPFDSPRRRAFCRPACGQRHRRRSQRVDAQLRAVVPATAMINSADEPAGNSSVRKRAAERYRELRRAVGSHALALDALARDFPMVESAALYRWAAEGDWSARFEAGELESLLADPRLAAAEPRLRALARVAAQ